MRLLNKMKLRMSVRELSKDQLTELKQNYYSIKLIKEHKEASYYELSIIDKLVSDEEIFKEYEDTIFSDYDFFCSCN